LARESGLRGADDPVKTTKLIAGFSVAHLAVLSAQAQGFVNLDFESASIPAQTSVGSLIPISEALPGWSAYFDSTTFGIEPTTQVGYDGVSTGGPIISVIDKNSQLYGPLQGSYSAFLFGGDGFSSSISQTGTIPTGSKSLLLDAWSYDATPIVAINGQSINLVPHQTFATYTLYDGDISSYAGSVTLSFTEPSPTTGGPSEFILDNISFSTNAPTPEPSIIALTAIGGLLFGARKWFARRRYAVQAKA